MTLPTTGPISMAMVASELGISATGLSLNDSRVRNLAGIPSGSISFANLRGKSASVPTLSISLSPSPAVGRASSANAGSGSVTVTASVSGGSGGYTFNWTQVGTGTGWGIANGTTASARFSHSVTSTQIFTTRFRCTVNDNGGRSNFAEVDVEIDGFSA